MRKPSEPAECRICGGEMEPGAVLCTNCGTYRDSGKRVRTERGDVFPRGRAVQAWTWWWIWRRFGRAAVASLVLLIAAGIIWFVCRYRMPELPGNLINEAPVQKNVRDYKLHTIAGCDVTVMATYSVKGLVHGWLAYDDRLRTKLCPIDLALGWGPMSNTNLLQTFYISQEYRRVYWDTPMLPMRREDVERNLANIHVCPADNTILAQIRALRDGDLVQLDGYLVRFNGPDGWSWVSSTTRADTGKDSGEIMYVKQVRRLPRP